MSTLRLQRLCFWAAGGAPIFAFGLTHAFGSLPAPVAVLLSAGTVYGPGLILDELLFHKERERDGFIWRLPMVFLLGLSAATLWATLSLVFGWSWGLCSLFMLALPVFAGALYAKFAARREAIPWFPPDFAFGSRTAATVAVSILLLVVLRAGAWIGPGDASTHMAAMHALLRHDTVAPIEGMLYLGEGADPRYSYSTWWVLLSAVARTFDLEVVDAWRWTPLVIFPLPALAWSHLDRVMRRGRGLTAFLLGVVFFGLAGEPAIRFFGYYQFPAFYVAYPVLLVLLLTEIEEPRRSSRLAMAAILFAGCSANPFYGGFLPLAAFSFIGLAALLVGPRFSVPHRRVLRSWAVLLLAAIVPLALRYSVWEVHNPAFSDSARVAPFYRSQIVELGAGFRILTPTVLKWIGFWDLSPLAYVVPVWGAIAFYSRRTPTALTVLALTLGTLAFCFVPILYTPLEKVVGPVYAHRIPYVLLPTVVFSDLLERVAALARNLDREWLGFRVLAVGLLVVGLLMGRAIVPVPLPGLRTTLSTGARELSLPQYRDPILLGQWLAKNCKPGVILADPEVSHILSGETGFPVLALNQAFASPAVTDADERVHVVTKVLDPMTGATERAALLAEYRVQYLVLPVKEGESESVLFGDYHSVKRSGTLAVYERAGHPASLCHGMDQRGGSASPG